MLREIRVISKTASNKSCSGFNFVQYVYPLPGVELKGCKDCQFQYVIIFRSCQFLEPPSTPVGDTRMRPLTFLYQSESLSTFIWRKCWHNAYFWQRTVLKWIFFPVSIHYTISKMASLETPISSLRAFLYQIKSLKHF